MKYTLPPGFDLNRAQELAKLVDAAYAQLDQGAAWQPPAGYTLREPRLSAKELWKVPEFLEHLIQPVLFGFVATRGNDVYVVFRGTKTPLEWLDDATFQPVSFQPSNTPWGQITRGFQRLYNDLGPQVLQALQGITSPPHSIFVTGHSLGGALTHLAAAGIAAQFGARATSYTFCGPRTGDAAFAAAFEAAQLQTWRIFNTEDLVPAVPPAAVKILDANMGMHSLPSLTPLTTFIQLGLTGYQHIGYPIAVTVHRDTVAGNHDLDTVCAELSAP